METAGLQTTEYKVLKYLGIGAGVVVAVLTGLAAAGVLPAEGAVAGFIAAVLAIAHALKGYAESRGTVKSALIYESGSAIRALGREENPPKQ